MKLQDTLEIAARKDRIHTRLDRSNWGAPGRPMLAGGNAQLEVSRRLCATAFGGIAVVHRLARALGLPQAIDRALELFRGPSPYTESDQTLSLAY